MVEEWEADPTAPNPYAEPVNDETFQSIRLELSREESEDVASGKATLHKMSKTGFLTTGLDLECRQYQLRCEVANRKFTSSKQKADLQEKRTALMTQINNWRQAQLVYTPYAAALMASSSAVNDNGLPRVDAAENIPLFMPSAFPVHARSTHDMSRICKMEVRLRLGEAYDALAEIQKLRRSAQWLWQFKKVNISGTGNKPNTRTLTIYIRISHKIDRAADRYRWAYHALSILDPDGDWSNHLKCLRKEDIRGPGKGPEEEKIPNGKYETSWIWLVPRTSKSRGTVSEEDVNNNMRVEWAKQRARMMRWKEENLLVLEEMRRVLQWFEWKACWWEQQANVRTTGSSDILLGVSAYAFKQAHILRQMAKKCATRWLPVLRENGIDPDWSGYMESNTIDQSICPELNAEEMEEVDDDDDGQGNGDVNISDGEEANIDEDNDSVHDFDFDD